MTAGMLGLRHFGSDRTLRAPNRPWKRVEWDPQITPTIFLDLGQFPSADIDLQRVQNGRSAGPRTYALASQTLG